MNPVWDGTLRNLGVYSEEFNLAHAWMFHSMVEEHERSICNSPTRVFDLTENVSKKSLITVFPTFNDEGYTRECPSIPRTSTINR